MNSFKIAEHSVFEQLEFGRKHVEEPSESPRATRQRRSDRRSRPAAAAVGRFDGRTVNGETYKAWPTQPRAGRRVAAAASVSAHLGSPVASSSPRAVRFDDRTTNSTTFVAHGDVGGPAERSVRRRDLERRRLLLADGSISETTGKSLYKSDFQKPSIARALSKSQVEMLLKALRKRRRHELLEKDRVAAVASP